jgi:methylmalonyl-CoA/ethylmalonyl-CoA epimerase
MIDHIGFLTPDFDSAQRVLGGLLGGEVIGIEQERHLGLEILWMRVGGTRLEFLRPLPGNERTAASLAAGGPRIHHLGIGVPDVSSALTAARAVGIATRDLVPRPGARGSLIGFIDPADVGGALIELVQPAWRRTGRD